MLFSTKTIFVLLGYFSCGKPGKHSDTGNMLIFNSF